MKKLMALGVLGGCLCAFAPARPPNDDGGPCSAGADFPNYAGPDAPGALILRASDGHPVQAAIIVPDNAPKALVVILPGAWFGRDDSYQELAGKLAHRGFASARFRQRCHLRSLALDTVKDIAALLKGALDKVPTGTPLVFLGHSRGAWFIMRGIVRGDYKPAGVIIIAGGHDNGGHYNEVISRAGKNKETAAAFFKKLERGELKDDATIPGDTGGSEFGYPPVNAAQFKDENELKNPAYQTQYLKTGTPTLLLVGSGDRAGLRGEFRRFAGKFSAAMGTYRLLPGFDHTLRDGEKRVPDVLPDAIAAWIQGLKRP